MKQLALLTAALILVSGHTYGDSIFDVRGTGRDIIPVTGAAAAMGGAVAASKDPLSSAPMNPFASAYAEKVTVTVGFTHAGTKTGNLGEEKRTVSTLFPTLALMVPFKGLSFMTGLFLEKEGKLSLTETGSAYEPDDYDLDFTRETSFHSVPIFVSVTPHRRLTVSAGLLFSAFDTREETIMDFDSDERSDVEDVSDISASGRAFSAGLLLDLDRVIVAGLYRDGARLDGRITRESRHAGIWSREDISISSGESFKVGVRLIPVRGFAIEADVDRSPWCRLKSGDGRLTSKTVERFAVGLEYRGDRIWRASRFPLYLGYYTQPLDWETELTGEITEQVFSVGTSLPIDRNRAAMSISLQIGRREAARRSDLEETIYAVSLSFSAIEAWKREIRR